MNKENYHCSFTAVCTPQQTYEGIARVSDWWTNTLEGKSHDLNDVFTVRFGPTFVTFKITAAELGKKSAWLVTDGHLDWLKDKAEWKDTEIVWEISEEDGMAKVDMTHVGLVPGIECYEGCIKGWDFFVKESLYKLISEGKGLPEQPKAER
jgi:hypothetical protein